MLRNERAVRNSESLDVQPISRSQLANHLQTSLRNRGQETWGSDHAERYLPAELIRAKTSFNTQ